MCSIRITQRHILLTVCSSSLCEDLKLQKLPGFKGFEFAITQIASKDNNALSTPQPPHAEVFHYFNKHNNILYVNRFLSGPPELTPASCQSSWLAAT